MRCRRLRSCLIGLVLALLGQTACVNRGELIRMTKDRDALRIERDRLLRRLNDKNARITRLTRQVRNLKRFGSHRPADLFAPVKLQIVGRTGGADYDGQPGHDGVTVYIRPLDADGHAVKVPGEIKVQLLDNSTLGQPRVLGYCVFNDPQDLRQMWYAHFFTDHYAVECRFTPGVAPPKSGKVLVSVEFVDYLTGRTLTASKEVEVSPG